jgi:MerR family mercuric resistance operon transcriptional regulator
MLPLRDRIAIGALATRTGCNIETIRYYERVGLLPTPARTAAGYRTYGPNDVTRLVFVRRARALGFSLREVRALLAMADSRGRSCAEVRDLAAAHLRDVRGKIADLQRMDRVLTALIARCARGDLPDCPLIDEMFRTA